MEPFAFAAASIALLLTPGPTNTLLATSGAANGMRRSLPLLAAEISGYMLAIALWRNLLGPMIEAMPVVEVILRGTVTLYLVYLAVRLWRHGSTELNGAGPVTFNRVLVTTFLNPKGLIFAFTLLPQGTHPPALLAWILALAVMILMIGGFWIAVGVSLRRGFGGVISSATGYRASAIALLLLAGAVGSQAFH
jgi:threonine/homoserine/homoserine lactone efflux protein